MRRIHVVLAHLLAVPVAALVSLLLSLALHSIASEPSVEIALHDTYFVVAHFHASIRLAACVAVTTLVARRYGRSSVPLHLAWGFLSLHVLAVIVGWGALLALFSWVWGWLYIGSTIAGGLATLLGLLVSLVSGLRSRPTVI